MIAIRRFRIPLLAVAAAALAPPAGAGTAFEYATEFGSEGSGPEQFFGPQGIAFDSQMRLWVSDAANCRMQVFDDAGNHLFSFGTFGSTDGRFLQPHDVAFDSEDNAYICDRYNHRVQVFDDSGNYLRQWGSLGSGDGQFNEPWGITLDASGFVYVTERDGNRIQKFTTNGDFVVGWGSEGPGPGEFVRPRGIAAFDGQIVVTGSTDDRIQIFEGDGTYVSEFGGVHGEDPGQFHHPALVKRGVNGNAMHIYILCWHNHFPTKGGHNARIQKFAFPDQYVTEFASSNGTGPGEFDHAQGLAFHPQTGALYISDTKNHRIQVILEVPVVAVDEPIRTESWSRVKGAYRGH
jgi:DNA-binding beta-propeller fold protein YncE